MRNNTELCPVCGMSVADDAYVMRYHKMTFHYCSKQCMETFTLTPKLYSSGFRGNRIAIIKKRTLLLEKECGEVKKLSVPLFLQAMMGVKEAVLDKSRLDISYDLMQTSLSQIIKELTGEEIQLSHAWFQRMKRSWIQYKEKNEIDNIKRGSGACCNRPPPRIG